MGSSSQSSVTFSTAGNGVHAARAFAARRPRFHGAGEQPVVITAAEAREYELLRAEKRQNRISEAADGVPHPSQIRVDNQPVLALPPSPPVPSNRRMLPPSSSFRGGSRGSPPPSYGSRGGGEVADLPTEGAAPAVSSEAISEFRE